jgi:hypothetical protein
MLPVIDRKLETSAQRPLRISSAQKLPHLAGQLTDLGFARLGERWVEGGDVEVLGGILQ